MGFGGYRTGIQKSSSYAGGAVDDVAEERPGNASERCYTDYMVSADVEDDHGELDAEGCAFDD
jgi:hypothetical protein